MNRLWVSSWYHVYGSWSSIAFILLSTISASGLPCSSLQACNTVSRMMRRGARFPVNSSNCANACSGSQSSPSMNVHSRDGSSRIWFIRGVSSVLYASSITTPPVGLFSQRSGSVNFGTGLSSIGSAGIHEMTIVGWRNPSGQVSSRDFNV